MSITDLLINLHVVAIIIFHCYDNYVKSTVQVASEGEETGVEDNNNGNVGSRNTPRDDGQVDSAAGHVYGLEEDEIDTRAFVPATAGLVMIELLKLPPQPKSINGWTIRQGM